MLENIMRHIEKGEPPMQAAFVGSKEVSFTIPSMTISLAAVFIPVVFMGGIVGRLLNEFAMTIVIAVLISGVVSLTLTPMLCARMIKSAQEEHAKRHNWFYRASERGFDRMQSGYASSLRWSLRHKRFIFVIFLGTLAATVQLFRVMPQDFLPSEDSNQLNASTEGANGISFAEMRRHQEEAAKIFAADPNVEGYQSSVNNSNRGNFSIQLKGRDERDLTVDEIINLLRPKFTQIPGINVIMQNRPPIRIGGYFTRALYQYTMQDIDPAELYRSSNRLLEAMSTNPMFTDVNTDLNLTTPSVNVAIDRDRAASLGITPQQIEVALGSAFGGQRVSPIYTQADQYWVILELLPQYQESSEALNRLYLATSRSATLTGNIGSLVPLTAVTRISRGTQPLTINHLGQLPAVTLSFNLPEGVALSDAVNEIQRVRDEIGIPASVVGTFQGTARAFQESQRGMGFLLIGGILVVYIVLGILYESFIHPLTILSGLPAAATGALLTLYLVGVAENGYPIPLTLYAFVGMIMLVGLVKKNSIMMVDFALSRQRTENVDPQTAIVEAALIRFRPIMMTSMAAFFGTIPIAIGMGDGGDARKPLGLAVVGGLLLSQALTLYITPVLYVYLDRLGALFGRRKAVPAPAE
jgi:HAE1 family hydrophobic/amphiphilic exporter-1